MKTYILLAMLILMIGFNTWVAVAAFHNAKWFAFGINIAWCIWWAAKMIVLAFEQWGG